MLLNKSLYTLTTHLHTRPPLRHGAQSIQAVIHTKCCSGLSVAPLLKSIDLPRLWFNISRPNQSLHSFTVSLSQLANYVRHYWWGSLTGGSTERDHQSHSTMPTQVLYLYQYYVHHSCSILNIFDTTCQHGVSTGWNAKWFSISTQAFVKITILCSESHLSLLLHCIYFIIISPIMALTCMSWNQADCMQLVLLKSQHIKIRSGALKMEVKWFI